MKGAKTNKKNVSSEPNPLSFAYNVLTRLLFRTPPSATLSSHYVLRCGGAHSANSTTPHSTQQRSANEKDKKSPRLKKTWVKESRRNSYDIVKRYRCAQTVLIGFVWTQHFCGFMSQNHSYLLLTQTAEKRTNGTNVGLLFPAFCFHRLGRCKSASILILKTSQVGNVNLLLFLYWKRVRIKSKKEQELDEPITSWIKILCFWHILVFFTSVQKPVITHNFWISE
jgi:hypothetical protein